MNTTGRTLKKNADGESVQPSINIGGVSFISTAMSNLNFALVSGDEVTDAQLKACATLFSQNYGVWSSLASSPLKPGVYLHRRLFTVKFLPFVLRYPREDECYSIKTRVLS